MPMSTINGLLLLLLLLLGVLKLSFPFRESFSLTWRTYVGTHTRTPLLCTPIIAYRCCSPPPTLHYTKISLHYSLFLLLLLLGHIDIVLGHFSVFYFLFYSSCRVVTVFFVCCYFLLLLLLLLWTPSTLSLRARERNGDGSGNVCRDGCAADVATVKAPALILFFFFFFFFY